MSHSREKITEIVPKKDAMMDLLDKGPQIIILKVLKEGYMKKTRMNIYEKSLQIKR